MFKKLLQLGCWPRGFVIMKDTYIMNPKKVDEILFMSDAEYSTMMTGNASYIMIRNAEDLPHLIVRNKILNSIYK